MRIAQYFDQSARIAVKNTVLAAKICFISQNIYFYLKIGWFMNNDTTIIGRKKEIQKLDSIVQSKKSEFLAVYGRRRVGKTFLIRERM